MTKKILTIILLVAVLVQGAGALDNVTVIETFPDGQPRHITHIIPLKEPKLSPSWTCPADQIPSPSETSIGGELLQRCKIMPSPEDYIRNETVERWLNSYGQTQKINYLAQDGKVQAIIPDTVDSALAASDWEDFYIDDGGEVVSYAATPDIASNKTVLQPIYFPTGYNLNQAMQDLNLTQEEAIQEKNYDAIKQAAYNHSPEAMQKKIAELEGKQLPEIKATVAALNETVAQHGTWLDRILNWINSTFNIDLH